MRPYNRLKNAALLITLAVFMPFLWMGLFTGPDLALEEAYEKRLAELRDRVQYAESLNRERENDVHHLRQQMHVLLSAQNVGNKTGGGLVIDQDTRDLLSNMSFGSSDIQPPSMFHYLPHLIGKPEGLRPALKMSAGRFGVSIVMGIPTIKRERDSYLLQTLESLLSNLNEDETDDCLIVVFVGEPDDLKYVQSVADSVKEKFPEAVAAGIVEVIAPSPSFYPDMNTLKESFGDTLHRVKWRTKQILDFSFLMLYARSRGMYYLQLEDDVVTKPGYLSIMRNFALSQKAQEWVLLEFSYLGFIGKLFKSSDLPRVVEFFLMFHRDKPIDWLLDHFLYVKVCNPEKDAKHCRRSINELRRRFKPSLFQHIGIHSSLNGKVQKLKDKDFGRSQLHRAHYNPNAQVWTSLKVYSHFSLDRAYMGETFFWATVPQADDVVMFSFDPPIIIEKFLFKSGNAEHPGDRFYNTTVEVLPATQTKSTDLNKMGPDGSNFIVVGEFDSAIGVAEGSISKDLGLIDTIRLHVLATSQSWVILNEIEIKELKTER